jgi:hypothetical protein
MLVHVGLTLSKPDPGTTAIFGDELNPGTF